jgi:seryl-tRNA synthetase
MLDIRLVRENPGLVRENLRRRKDPGKLELLGKLIKHDRRYRDSLQRLEQLRHERNVVTERIARLRAGKKPFRKEIAKAGKIPAEIKRLEGQTEKLREKTRSCLMGIPNLLHDSVPYGKGDEDNAVVSTFGKPPGFGFSPRPHLEIAEGLGMMDMDRAADVAGAGFFYLRGELALLEQAIIRYAIDFMVKRGYTLVFPPLMMRRKPYEGVVDLGDFESVMYKVEGDDLYLIATSEHPIAAMLMDRIVDAGDLPARICGVSPCFRRETGAHGKYTKGLFRVHNFNKVEQFIFCRPEDSWKLHEELQRNSNDLYKGLGLHFRVMNVCTGDMGSIAAKKYDTDVWMADGEYREAGSNSNCTDYQARRLNIRYREAEGTAPEGFVHTLNSTALATSRTMVAILEQYQREDGSVAVPRVLLPYMGGIRKIAKR